MSLKMRYTISWENGPEHMKRKFAPNVTAALESLGKWWFQERLPEHFTPQAKREYGYADRARKYKKIRAIRGRLGGADTPDLLGITNRKKGKQRGTLMRTVKRAGTIRASSKRLTVQMQAPRYVNMRSRQGQGPDKVAEITAISKAEARQMPILMERWLVRLTNVDRTKSTKRYDG